MRDKTNFLFLFLVISISTIHTVGYTETNHTEINVIDADVDVGTTHGQWLKTSICSFVQL